MTIEEKAKAYDEAIERAKAFNKRWQCIQAIDSELALKELKEIFPELKESEDERIRKELLEHCKNQAKPYIQTGNECPQIQSWIAWLEKQGNKDKLIKELGEYKTKYTQEVLEKHINSMSNKDDEIRKALIKGFNECVASSSHYPENAIKYWNGIVIEDILAWLGKQCEKKQLYIRFGDVPFNETSKVYRGEVEIGDENGVSVYPAFEVNGNIVLGLTLPITKTTLYTQQHLLEYDNRPCYLVSGDYVGKGTDGEPLIRNISIIKRLDNYRIKEVEKQGEQKVSCTTIVETGNGGINALVTEELPTNDCDDEQNLADKVEPKFKVGDLIKHNKANIICKVISVNSGSYYVENIETSGRIELFNAEQNFHLWTIQDAKEGDVLAYVTDEEDLWIMIYWSLYEPYEGHVHYHALLVNDNFSDKGTCCICINDLKPATKEQRELLFSKMKEARYEWDAKRKKLKKIDARENLTLDGDLMEADCMLAEQKPTWSEEDDYNVQCLVAKVVSDIQNGNVGRNQELIDWLKSLKQKIGG